MSENTSATRQDLVRFVINHKDFNPKVDMKILEWLGVTINTCYCCDYMEVWDDETIYTGGGKLYWFIPSGDDTTKKGCTTCLDEISTNRIGDKVQFGQPKAESTCVIN